MVEKPPGNKPQAQATQGICDTKGSPMGEYADWKDLAGRQVQVQREGRTIRTGYVKDVAVIADALWLEAYGAEPRTLYEKAQGYTVLPIRPDEVSNA
jgi:hypothetical protein